MKTIVRKIVTGKKIRPKTVYLVKRLARYNCKAAHSCFRNNVFSKKCYQVSKVCLTMKSIVKKITAKKVGTVMSKLIKNFVN